MKHSVCAIRRVRRGEWVDSHGKAHSNVLDAIEASWIAILALTMLAGAALYHQPHDPHLPGIDVAGMAAMSAIDPEPGVPDTGFDPGPVKMTMPEHMNAIDWIMAVAYATESSYGEDCGRGSMGEKGCYQIWPPTAAEYGCVADDSASCARRIIVDGINVCGLNFRRVIHRYNTGECSSRKTAHVQKAIQWFETLQDKWHAEHRRA